MIRKVKEEERLREEAGYYDEELDTDDEGTRKLLADAEKIEEKEKLIRLEHTLKKVDRPHLDRRVARKRERTLDKLENELGALGVDMKKRKMEKLRDQSEKPLRGKNMKRLGRSLSLQPKNATPKDQLLKDVEVDFLKLCIRQSISFQLREKSKKIARKAQRPWQQEARKGEADRRILDAKPKHLFSGKRGIGKTERR
jgi:nucleolar GTP-binding protein